MADTYNACVRAVSLNNGRVSTLAGAGGARGDADGPAAAARFRAPRALAQPPAPLSLFY